ncbi:MAG: basic rane lipoprotein [Gemmatimonadetes bacterium]|nr:basic rane lipoprotein [Gemmatimonadota bacterium]
MSRWWLVGVVPLLLFGCSQREQPDSAKFRVALVTPGSIADAAWNSGAYAGLMMIKDSLGAEVSHVEARTPGEQEEQLRTYAAQGYPIVFGHGFEFQDAAERVARQFPQTVFVITSGQRVAGNVVPLIFRLSEATYLAGMVAGSLTRTNKIGYVGGMELPPVKLAYEAWAAGARAVNPNVQSRETYLNNFDDAVAGREAALAMIQLGVDMLHHNADAAGLGLFQAAKERPGVYLFGANADQSSLAPDRVIGSAVIDLPRAFLLVAREVQEGRFVPRVESFGLESGVIQWVINPALDTLVPAALRDRVRATADSIVAGTLVPVDRATGQMAEPAKP